ncbi:MAG: Tn3 family transposase [Verrucomicrobia bacterium]|nr:Tn3 family transposase [Verrucomicrobiota bacterium]
MWNTRYLEQTFVELERQGVDVSPTIVAHVAPLGWEHVGPTGDYVWSDGQRTCNPMIRNQVDMRRFKDAPGGMRCNRAGRPNYMLGNMGGCQFVILAERGLTAIADGFDIPALGRLTRPAPHA